MKSLLLFLSLVTVAPAMSNASRGVHRDNLAYFNFASGGEKVTVSGGNLIKKITGSDAISQSELNFLDSNYSLQYSSFPDEYKKSIEFATFNDKVYVEAKPYSYKSGTKTYTWVPHSIEVNENEYAFTKNEFSNQYIVEAPVNEDSEINVNYQITFSLEKDKVNHLLNAAYLEGKDAYEVKDKYETDKKTYEKYISDLETYADRLAAYLEYKTKLDNYNAYLDEYQQYQEAYSKYLAYLDDVASFDDRVAEYNAYLEALAFYNRNRDVNQKEYEAFVEATKYASYQLSAMNILWTGFTINGLNRVASEMILGNSVTTVLESKSELVTLADAPSLVIDEAYEATNNIREYIKKYKALTTNAERYRYYYYYYYYIRTNTEMLLRCLDKLYRSGKVASIIESKGKKTQYTILIAELAYFCNAIDDQDFYNYEGYSKTGSSNINKPGAQKIDQNWKFAGKTYAEWLGGDLLDTTKIGEPKSSAYPEKEVELLLPPEEVTKPEIPTPVVEPIAPAVVPSPGQEVKKPDDLVEVDEPVKPNFDKIHLDLISSYEKGALVQRSIDHDHEIKFEESVKLDLSDKKNVAIFHDEHDNPIYYSFYNIGARFVGEAPSKEKDGKTVYCTWYDGEDKVDLASLSTSVELYPQFINIPVYRVTFVIGDKTILTYYSDGETPSYDNPTKEDTNIDGQNYYYVFKRWNKEFAKVDRDEVYEAEFYEYPYCKVTYRVNGEDYLIQEYKSGEYAIRPENYPNTFYVGEQIYEFLDWDYSFGALPITDDIVINAKFADYYCINFNTDGVDKIKWVKKGNVPTYDETPTKAPTYTEYFTFKGWAKTSGGGIIKEFDKAKQSTTYFAVFDSHPIATASGTVSASLIEDTIVIEASNVTSPTFDVTHLIEKFKKNPAKSCTFKIDNAKVTFSESHMEMLTNLNAASFKFDKVRTGNNNYTVELIIKNNNGEIIQNDSLQPLVTLFNLKMADHYLVSSDDTNIATTAQNNTLTFKSKLGVNYKLSIRYNVNIEYFGKATIKVDKPVALPGETITVSYIVNDGYTFYSAYAKTLEGQIELDENNQFVMPGEDVTINVVTSKKVFNFNYYVDGKLAYHISGGLGDMVDTPFNVTKERDSQYQYVFTGWDKDIKIMENDVDFHATFDAIPLVEPLPAGSGKYSSMIGIGILAGSVILVVGGLIFLVIFLVKRKH